MRCLIITNHCITDPTAGAMRSLRTMAKWLTEDGHPSRIVTTARFGSPVPFTIDEHLQTVADLAPMPPHPKGGRLAKAAPAPIARYGTEGVPVSLLMTRHNDEGRPDRGESAQFLALIGQTLDEFTPDLVVACNGHPMIRAALAAARSHGAKTVFALRGYGYDDRRFFDHVDGVLTCSRFLTESYRRRIGIDSTPIPPPLDWASIEAPMEPRGFVTFVHPAPHKGLFHFARLAAMLGSRRPDIPVLVVGSGHSAGALNGIPGIDFSQYPHIVAAPAVASPADYLALTRLLLVPSVFDEPFGRVAAEAMVNGIPPIVSDRGGLPEVVGGDLASGGGGRVLPLPAWLNVASTRTPTEAEVEPWFAAVCALWDDEALYARTAGAGRRIAAELYAEDVLRTAHLGFFRAIAGA